MSKKDTVIDLFSTCPPSAGVEGSDYLDQVIQVSQWSEQSGCKGILVYSDNSQVDPWLLAHVIVAHTETLCPLVAVQPIYMHPYTIAKAVTSIAWLYRRRVYLNMVAGGFKGDLAALNDATPHDLRYKRLVEYTSIISQLLRGEHPVRFRGEFYQTEGLRLSPACPKELFPGIFISGSSEAGRAAAKEISATAIEYPKPVMEGRQTSSEDVGIRIGIVSRQDHNEAWNAAFQRFPVDRRGQLTHQLAMKVSDSVWHRQLSDLANQQNDGKHPYWLVPFENYKTMCPYLVGDHREVGKELAGYIELGYRTFITDVPENAQELQHIGIAFNHALESLKCQTASRIG
jgi:alkanesulfonate monooxygenase